MPEELSNREKRQVDLEEFELVFCLSWRPFAPWRLDLFGVPNLLLIETLSLFALLSPVFGIVGAALLGSAASGRAQSAIWRSPASG
jgi:hypothetical protein